MGELRQVRVENLTRGVVLAQRAGMADGVVSRGIGLIGRKGLAPDEGLIIAPCNSVHTCFMSFVMDAVFVDKDNVVVGVKGRMKPWRFSRIYRGAKRVLELSGGAAEASGTQVGDRLSIG